MDVSEIARKAIRSHEELDREIEILKLRIGAPYQSSIVNWMTKCTEHFRIFHTLLRAHMEMEEYGGFMQPVRERRPTLTNQVEKLRQEHRELVKECNQIETLLEECKDPTERDVHDVRSQIEELFKRIQVHERVENELVQKVFVQDIGVAD